MYLIFDSTELISTTSLSSFSIIADFRQIWKEITDTIKLSLSLIDPLRWDLTAQLFIYVRQNNPFFVKKLVESATRRVKMRPFTNPSQGDTVK